MHIFPNSRFLKVIQLCFAMGSATRVLRRSSRFTPISPRTRLGRWLWLFSPSAGCPNLSADHSGQHRGDARVSVSKLGWGVAVKFVTTALVLLSAWSPLARADEPTQKEESASTRYVITRPGDGGVFVGSLRNLRSQKDEDRPFEWKEIDDKIDEWFVTAKTRFPEDYKKHAANWDALCEQSKREARVALGPVEQAWKDSVERAASDFETSEAEFYARVPTLLVSGTYRYFEGQRDRSGVQPSWELAAPELIHVGSIRGENTHDTGEIVLKAAGMNHPMFNLKCSWTFSLEAAIDPKSLDVRPNGSINTPKIVAYVRPRFDGTSNYKFSKSWGYYDNSSTAIGPVKLTIGDTKIATSMSLGTGFTFCALDDDAFRPALEAGVNEPALIK